MVSRWVIIAQLLLAQLLQVADADDTTIRSLFDLASDPFEQTNLFDSALYASTAVSLEARLVEWQAVNITEDIQVDEDNALWRSAGGLVPWQDFASPPPKPVRPTTVAQEEAPNLVFFMLDDVGWNDVGYQESTWIDFSTPHMDLLVSEGIHLTNHYTG